MYAIKATQAVSSSFEEVQKLDAGEWLIKEFVPNVREVLVVIAGRSNPESIDLPFNIKSYQLQGFTLEDTKEYFSRFRFDLVDKDIEKVWKLTEGNPGLIELVLYEMSNNSLELLSKIDQPHKLKELLARRFASDIPPSNSLIQIMAYFNRRFDIGMLNYLIKNGRIFSRAEEKQIYNSLEQTPYIKNHPSLQSYLLSDELQQIISEYVLPFPKYGISDILGQELYDLIVNQYYPKAIAEANPELARQLRVEHLGYVLDRDIELGLDFYRAYLDEVHKTNELHSEELLWNEVSKYFEMFTSNTKYQLFDERISWLSNRGLFQKVENLARQMEVAFPDHSVEIKQILSYALLRQRKLEEAATVTQEIIALVHPDDYKAIAVNEDSLAQIAQKSGKWDQAMRHYALSLRAASLINDATGMARVYLGRGYLFLQQGQYDLAKEQFKRVLALFPNKPKDNLSARFETYAYINLGSTFSNLGDYKEAKKHLKKSLSLSQSSQDLEASIQALQTSGINEY
ncbi:MAG: tetratricopeptide repeat protein, partial [Bdellovibrio sp.]|nr:tetratricopeptide repeat protein [Bdellovibrio sp.]